MKAKIKLEDGRVLEGEFKEVEEVKKRFRSKNGGVYYFINSCGVIDEYYENGHGFDDNNWETGNYHKTEKEAGEIGLQKLEKEKAIQRVKDYVMENFGVFKPDWTSEHQEKYRICYSASKRRFKYASDNIIKEYSPFGYLESSKNSIKLIKDCEKDLKIIFDVE